METSHDVAIGKLGEFSFPTGYYVYVGSAKRNIKSRINRHIDIDKKKHWHMDYLRPYLKIESVRTFSGAEEECALFNRLKEAYSGSLPARGFGSSDCKCESHLFYSREEIVM